ncbi:MAG: hypothetical protein ACXVJC_21735 [Mucilaginibacter sp.]
MDREISSILNFVKLLCAPNSKTEVHLSIRGPYKSKLKPNKIHEYNEMIKNSRITVTEAGNFFQENQNTVFLKCESEIIEKVWKKTTYKKDVHGINAHLTLYDGKDRVFAHKLYELLLTKQIHITFLASELIFYDTSKSNLSLMLTYGIDIQIVEDAIRTPWNSLDLIDMPNEDRLKLISKCFEYLELLNSHSVAS